MIKKTIFFFLVFKSILLYSSNPLPKDSLTGNFDLGLNFTKNTESTFQFNNISLLKYQKGKSSLSFKNNIAFISKTGESELLNKGMQDFKYALNLKKIDINLTLNHTYDISRSIKHRYGTGLGITYNLTDEDDKKIRFGISAIREKNIPLKGEEKLQNRMSGNFDLLFKLNKHVSLTTSNLYQPNIEATGDFRWQTNLSLRISLYSHFALSINSIFNYDSFPEKEIPETDYQLINSISYTF